MPRLFDKPQRIVGSPSDIEDYVAGQTSSPMQTFQPRQQGLLSGIGQALSGISAPFVGDMDYAIKQAKLQQERDQADLEFQKYIIRNRGTTGVYQIDPISGQLEQAATVPYGSKVYKGVLSPEQMKERAVATGSAEAIKKNIEMSDKLAGAVKKLSVLNKQYNEAFPSGDRTPLEQRVLGGASSWAAQKGLVDNPKLVALKKNARPIAINLIRLFGEVGNLSESEQKGALDVASQEGLTEAERFEQVRQFADYALAGASPEAIKALKGRKDIQGILDSFNITLGEEESGSNVPQFDPKTQRLQQNKKTGEYRVVPLKGK